MLANLKNAIRVRRMRGYEFAALMGICPSTLTEIISEQRETAPGFRRRAAKLLGADEGWLFEPLELGPPPELTRHSFLQNGGTA